MMDYEDAMRKLAHLASEGKRAGKSLDEAEGSAKNLGVSISGIITTQGYTILRDAAQALSAGYRETADYLKQISAEYIGIQAMLQQTAALRGVQNTGAFTVQQAKEAEAAGLRPEQWARFQEQFQSYAGAYLEGDQQKMSASEAVKYQQQLAAFATARGINPAEIAQLGGGILQFATGEMTADQAMAAVGRQFKTLERAPTPVAQLLPQMTRIMAQGATGEEASQLLGIMSEAMPGEENTGVENTLKALQHALLKGTAGDLGVTKDMSPLQRIKTAAENLAARQSRGEDIDPILASMFPDLREQRGIRGFINRGVLAGGFARTAGYAAETPDDFTATVIADYEASDRGRQARAEAANARASIEAGERLKEVARLKLLAEQQLKDERRFEDMTGVGDTIRGLIPWAPDRRTQLINERAAQLASQQSGRDATSTSVEAFGSSQAGIDKMILDELKVANEQRAKGLQRPLSAPAPQPAERP